MEAHENLNMNRICQHCDKEIVGNAYNVTSEYEGARLLDLTVCTACASEARILGLRTEEITPQQTMGLARRGAHTTDHA
jgi:superfamily II helicase